MANLCREGVKPSGFRRKVSVLYRRLRRQSPVQRTMRLITHRGREPSLRDPDLTLMTTNPLLDRIRKEPRFPAIERARKFAD